MSIAIPLPGYIENFGYIRRRHFSAHFKLFSSIFAVSSRMCWCSMCCIFLFLGSKIQKHARPVRRPPSAPWPNHRPHSVAGCLSEFCFLCSIDVVHPWLLLLFSYSRQTIKMMRCIAKRCCPHQTTCPPLPATSPARLQHSICCNSVGERRRRTNEDADAMPKRGRCSPIDIDENDVQLQFVGFCCTFQGKNTKRSIQGEAEEHMGGGI